MARVTTAPPPLATGPVATGAVYRGLPDIVLLAHDLGGLTALYHCMSGQTHIVGEPIPALLALLGEAPGSAADIAARAAATFDLGAQTDAAATIAAHLAELDALGLVTVVEIGGG